jgi:hypothetical protein
MPDITIVVKGCQKMKIEKLSFTFHLNLRIDERF